MYTIIVLNVNILNTDRICQTKGVASSKPYGWRGHLILHVPLSLHKGGQKYFLNDY